MTWLTFGGNGVGPAVMRICLMNAFGGMWEEVLAKCPGPPGAAVS